MILGRYILFVMLLTTILTLPGNDTVSAKGPLEQVNISGPGWGGEFVVTDPELLKLLGAGMFEDFFAPVEAVNDLGRGYLLTRGFLQGGAFQPFDQVMYFANTTGARGYVYNLGIVNGVGPDDGGWYHVSSRGEAVIQEFLRKKGVYVTPPPTPAEACSATPYADDVPVSRFMASFTSTWFRNEDRTLWAGLSPTDTGQWQTGGVKVLWWQPEGGFYQDPLIVYGKRLDWIAAPLKVELPSAYTTFQPSSLNFPTGGCWEVTGKLEDTELRFTVYVTQEPNQKNSR
jgi:hypothetical protein